MSVIESTKTFAPAGTWAADPVHSNVSFEVAYAGVSSFRGSFTDFGASLEICREVDRMRREQRRLASPASSIGPSTIYSKR